MKCVKMVDGTICRVSNEKAVELVGGSAAEYVKKAVWKAEVRDKAKVKKP